MAKERENFSKTEIDTTPESGVPVFSFNTSESADKLNPEHFDISGNKFSAFYDNAHKLIFVLDETKTDNTPNTLLVIADRQGRKWDDILGNDYKMDLEDIRPKENNKYQKLDIDYNGLPIYGQLVADYKTGGNITNSLNSLNEFRADVGHQMARTRLSAAEREIEIATTTIEKTNESIAKLRTQIKSLKTKLSKTRGEVGKKPTKESASKILKIQSQIDKATEKEKRAQIRLRRAKKRLEDAENDAKIARGILNIDKPEIIQPKEPKMAEDPKPLFNKDPEIMDDKIAFQPVGFDVPAFVPMDDNFEKTEPVPQPQALPTPQTVEPIVVEPVVNVTTPTFVSEPAPIETLSQPKPIEPAPVAIENPTAAQPPVVAAPTAPAQIERPSSPTTGQNITVLNPVVNSGKKPTMIYYVMLIILIALSILTLWIYQSKIDNSSAPNLAAPIATETAEPTPMVTPEPPAFITPEEPVVAVPEPEPIVAPQPVVMPQPEPEPIPEPVAEEPMIQQPATMPEPEQPIAAPTLPMVESQPQPEPMPEPTMARIEKQPMPIVNPEPEVNKPEYPVYGPNKGQSSPEPNAQVCTSGSAPDEDGCCAGENLKWVASFNGYACCSVADGECYPPLK